MTAADLDLVCVGSYAAEQGAEGAGVTLYERNRGSGALRRLSSVPMPSPSYLVADSDRRLLYAVNEVPGGTVTTMRVRDDGTPDVASVVSTGGDGPCHGALTADRKFVVCANYADGTIGVVRLDHAGVAEELVDVTERHGSGPVAGRQDRSHPHMVLPVAAGHVCVADLGTDEIVTYSISAAGLLDETHVTALPPGSGPRHMALLDPQHDAGQDTHVAVTCELAGSVAIVDLGRPTSPVRHRRTRAVAVVAQSRGAPSHLEYDSGTKSILFANRGVDTLSECTIGGAASETQPDGASVEVGAGPRHFARIETDIYVAALGADRIDLVRRAPRRRLDSLAPSIAARIRSPACVVRL